MFGSHATSGFDFGERLAELSRIHPATRLRTAEQVLRMLDDSSTPEEVEEAAFEYLLALPEPARVRFRCDFCGIGLTDGVTPCSHCGCVFEAVEPAPTAIPPLRLVPEYACGYCGSTRGDDPDYPWCIDCKGV